MSVEGIKVDSGKSRVDSPSHLCEYKLNAISLHFPLLLVYTLLGGRKEEAAVAPEKKKEMTAVREEE
ncbi:hypothetical protein PIB30_101124 [Stylosanthes scabra]|uniref:Uncharacterized protein n=1 Tax=Stylosanthes scabra TaxID=79078 RepID=A0ABU6RY12_9FABA|nr:hypothetical protein [Stylosanthes scabra]